MSGHKSELRYVIGSDEPVGDAIVAQILQELYIDHLVLRVQDLAATRSFYRTLFGEPLSQTDDSVMYMVGDTRIFFTLSSQKIITLHDKEQPGLNHIAFGIHDSALLRGILHQLDAAGLRHSGIRIDNYGKKEFIWLDDPSGFRLEFYCRPTIPSS
jgi:catechol-2,3-dioxygenase